MPDAYAESLIEAGVMTKDEVGEITKQQFDVFDKEFQQVETFKPEKSYFDKQWEGFVQAPKELTIWDTGVAWNVLSYIGRNSVYHPPNFVRNLEVF